MAICQVDIQSLIPWEPSATGFYYWTNTYFYNDAIQPSDNPTYYWCSVAHGRSSLTVTAQNGQKRTSPPGSGNYIGGGFLTPVHGDLVFTGGWSPFNVGRLTFWAGGKAVGYKLWRMPIPNNEILDGGLLSSWAMDALNNACGVLLHALITTRDGTPIENITASPRVHMWGFRHGTKRRDRQVIHIP